jgi:hypothetical protein
VTPSPIPAAAAAAAVEWGRGSLARRRLGFVASLGFSLSFRGCASWRCVAWGVGDRSGYSSVCAAVSGVLGSNTLDPPSDACRARA